MTKTLLYSVLLITTSLSVCAQNSVEKGDFLINPSVTLGWYSLNYGLNQTKFTPPMGLNFEYQIADYVGLGMEGIYCTRTYTDYTFDDFNRSYKYSYQSIAFRGSFHYFDLLRNIFSDKLSNEKLDKLDLYIFASLGVQWTKRKETWRNPNTNITSEQSSFDSGLQYGAALGARYYLLPRFAVFTEAGRNYLGWAKVGVTFKV